VKKHLIKWLQTVSKKDTLAHFVSGELHCVSKKVHPCHFHDNSVKWKPI